MKWNDQKRAEAIIERLEHLPQACGFFLRQGYFLVSYSRVAETVPVPILLYERLCRFETRTGALWQNLQKLLAKHFNNEILIKDKDFDTVTITICGDGEVLYERPATLHEEQKLNINFRKLQTPVNL
ncbi:hypothetical protein HQ571_02375 [Candidatus Kuenenbacteria bacterium]|nr:hypothetical protein [Candidatus Kuenenbacteria bacterium]